MEWSDRMQGEGAWQRFKGNIKEKWGDLTDDDLDSAEGNWDQLVGAIKERTGETAEAIENRLRSWAS